MGEAGFGAEEQASRHARRLARLREEEALGASVDAAAVRRAERDLRNWSVGAEGERAVAEALAFLRRYGWTALHDVHWPGRPQANIDHIAIGPGGVIVIDAKNWSGHVAVSGTTLRQNGYARTRESGSVIDAAAAVTALLAPEHRTAVLGVLCLAGQDQEPTVVDGGAVLVGRRQLPVHLLGLPARLSVHDVSALAGHLERQLAGRTSPGALTTGAFRNPRPRAGRRPNARRRPTGGPRPSPRTAGPARRASRSTGVGGALLRLGGVAVALLVGGNLLTSFLESVASGPAPTTPVGVVAPVGGDVAPAAPLPAPPEAPPAP